MNKLIPSLVLASSLFLANCPGNGDDGDDSMLKDLLLLNLMKAPVVGVWVQPVNGSTTKGACQWLNTYKSDIDTCFTNYSETDCYARPATGGHEGSSVIWSVSAGATSTDKGNNLCIQNGYDNCEEYIGNYLECRAGRNIR